MLVSWLSLLSATVQSQFTGIVNFQPRSVENLNVITTAVPLLSLNPNTNSAGMGMTDAVVFDGDESVGFYGNPSGFIQDTKRLTVNTYYTPWLVALVPGMNIAGADVASSIGRRQVVGLRYSQFTAPQITGSVSNGITERYIQVNYAYNLSKSFNLGVAFKYVYSSDHTINMKKIPK